MASAAGKRWDLEKPRAGRTQGTFAFWMIFVLSWQVIFLASSPKIQNYPEKETTQNTFFFKHKKHARKHPSENQRKLPQGINQDQQTAAKKRATGGSMAPFASRLGGGRCWLRIFFFQKRPSWGWLALEYGLVYFLVA